MFDSIKASTFLVTAGLLGVSYFQLPSVVTQEQTAAVSKPVSKQETASEVIKIWPGNPPGEPMEVDAELDTTKPSDDKIAGQRVMRITNVSTPELHVFLPPEDQRNGCSVVICPGGGFYILAWDLEGTEVAKWLNSIGVSAFILKYRVPTHAQNPDWQAPTQDTQRAISLIRSRTAQWKLSKDKIGVLGFSAGGVTAVRTSTSDRLYPANDKIDEEDCKPDFSILVYSGGVANKLGTQILDDLKFSESTPPAFLVHAKDDFVPFANSTLYAETLKKFNVPVDLHVFETGGHGYGLRPVENSPVTGWPKLCEKWLKSSGLIPNE